MDLLHLGRGGGQGGRGKGDGKGSGKVACFSLCWLSYGGACAGCVLGMLTAHITAFQRHQPQPPGDLSPNPLVLNTMVSPPNSYLHAK